MPKYELALQVPVALMDFTLREHDPFQLGNVEDF